MNEPKGNCYETAEHNLLARFETKQGAFALPYMTLLCVHLTPPVPGNAAEVLTLVYTTHTVTIEGKQLSSLLFAFQKGRVESVRSGGDIAREVDSPAIRQVKVAEGHPKNQSI